MSNTEILKGLFVDALTGETYIRELTAKEIAELPTSTETDILQDETPTAG